MSNNVNSTYRTTLLVCAIVSLVAFFLPVLDIMGLISLSGFDMVRVAFSGPEAAAPDMGGGMGGGMSMSQSSSPSSGVMMYLPLLMPLTAIAKFASYVMKSRYSHVVTAVVAIVLTGYYGLQSFGSGLGGAGMMGFNFFGIGLWAWLAASITCPIVAYSVAEQETQQIKDQVADAECPECGTAVTSDTGFCGNCGATLA